MSGEGYRVLLLSRSWGKRLREKGFTWDQIADVLELTHNAGPLRRYRLAHGRTAAEVVSMVNDADPAGTACMREARLYSFETWPEAGRRPSARLLAMLAKIYQTAATCLVTDDVLSTCSAVDRDEIDGADFRDLDVNRPREARVTMEPSAAATPTDTSLLDASACVRLLRAIDVEETDVKRRELLFQLALVLGGSKALDFLRILTPDEEDRLAGVLRNTCRVDETTARTFEKLTMHARQADDKFGPVSLLPVVNGHRTALAQILARESMSPMLRDRLLSSYAQLSQLSGFLAYDLLDYAAAEHAANDGLRAALELGDPTSIGYMHCRMSTMAAYRQQATAALDHAFAARGWAARSPSKLLRAQAESVTSQAHALGGKALASAQARDSAMALAAAPGDSEPAFLYWVSPSMIESKAARSLIWLRQAGPAVTAAQRSLAGLDPSYKRERAFALVQYAEAMILAKEIPEATSRLAEAAGIAAKHSSARPIDQLKRVRAHLEPWAGDSHVRRLDETLRFHGLKAQPISV
ncbi:hypothetical protein ACFOY2_15480 [Nonomuraea purpurea]|uniref:XRE family transcriptional regulator n=1 Tax=Nonomuraea purpurea TaxID=1849276 RepID=A0ABV8G3S6_9ACTN